MEPYPRRGELANRSPLVFNSEHQPDDRRVLEAELLVPDNILQHLDVLLLHRELHNLLGDHREEEIQHTLPLVRFLKVLERLVHDEMVGECFRQVVIACDVYDRPHTLLPFCAHPCDD